MRRLPGHDHKPIPGMGDFVDLKGIGPIGALSLALIVWFGVPGLFPGLGSKLSKRR